MSGTTTKTYDPNFKDHYAEHRRKKSRAKPPEVIRKPRKVDWKKKR